MKRSAQENIVLILCTACFVGVSPLFVLRLINSDRMIATIDGLIILISGLIALYVIKYRKVRIPSIALTFLYMGATVLLVYLKGPSLIYWAYPAMVTAYFLLKPSEAAIANSVTMLGFLPVISSELEHIEYVSIVITLIVINVFSFIIYRSMYGYQNQLAKLANRDSLTDTGNRRLYDKHIELCVNLKKRNNDIFSLIVLDIDNFKIVNDTFGHGKGDEVLKKVIALLRLRIRESDDIYRIGGDEFAILLRGSGLTKANKLGEALRALIQKEVTLLPEYEVTISLGVTELAESDSPKSLLHRADLALYKAKELGRNKVCLESPSQNSPA